MSLKKKYQNFQNRQDNYILNQSPLTRLIMGVVCSCVICAVSLLFVEGIQGKVCAAIVPLLLFTYSVYSYIKEKKNDHEFAQKQTEYKTGEKYRSVDWGNEYTEYRMNVGFEQIKASSMKAELLRRFRQRELLVLGLLYLFFSVGGAFVVLFEKDIGLTISLIDKVVCIFGGLIGFFLALSSLSEFAGIPVIMFYEKNKNAFDFTKMDNSFMKGKMLSYKKNGINLCYDYVVYYANGKVGAVEIKNIENVSRKVVRVKKYQDSLYAGDEYRYFAEFSIKSIPGQKTANFEIELKDVQVQMVLDYFKMQRIGGNKENIEIGEKADENVVI